MKSTRKAVITMLLALMASMADALQPTVVATGLSSPMVMAVDGDFLYFTAGYLTISSGQLYRIPKSTANLPAANLPPPFVGGFEDITFDQNNIFIHNGDYRTGAIYRMTKNLSQPAFLVDTPSGAMVGVIGSDLYFSRDFASIAKINVLETNSTNWQNVTPVGSNYFLRQKALDATSIFFTSISAPQQLLRFDIGTGVVSSLMLIPSEGNMFIDDANVYFTPGYAGGPGVFKVSKQGGPVTTLVPATNGAVGYAVGGGYVYYVENSTLWAIPSGGGTPVGLASPVDVHNIVYSNGTLYWGPITGDTIYRLDIGLALKPSLEFPLANFIADNAPINSAFDHSMRNELISGTVESTIGPYKCDGRVIAYTGEIGLLKGWPKMVPNCKNQPGYRKPTATTKASAANNFIVNGNYQGAGTPDLLNYDGHAGIDYQARIVGTHAFAALGGTVEYPLDIVGALGGRAYNTFHTLAIIPDEFPGYRIYYLHLSSHPLDFGAGQTLTVSDSTPGCPTTVTFPIPAGTHVSSGCLVALTGQAGTCVKNKCAPHLHFEVQRRVLLTDLGTARSRLESSMLCPDDASRVCVPVDPYGWAGAPTDCATIGTLNADPASPSADFALGDYYQCDTGIKAERLWK